MTPQISIIVPVFGVEKYIERCARSLFAQTLDEDIEFIFVDDATPDGSIAVLERVIAQFPQRKHQVKILRHSVNRGLPAARRTGLLAAGGEYIANVDSDDWIEPDFAQSLLDAARSAGADIVVFNYFTSSMTADAPPAPLLADRENYFRDLLTWKAAWSVCAKLIRRSLYFEPAPIHFPTEYMGEDMVQAVQLVSRARRIEFLDRPLYHYFYNAETVSRTVDASTVIRRVKALTENTRFAVDFVGAKFGPRAFNKELTYLKFEAKAALLNIDAPEARELYVNTFPEINSKILLNPYVDAKTKIRHLGVILKSKR